MAGFPSLLDTLNHSSQINVRHPRQQEVNPKVGFVWHLLVDTTQHVGNRQAALFSTSIRSCAATLCLLLEVRQDPPKLVV